MCLYHTATELDVQDTVVLLLCYSERPYWCKKEVVDPSFNIVEGSVVVVSPPVSGQSALTSQTQYRVSRVGSQVCVDYRLKPPSGKNQIK